MYRIKVCGVKTEQELDIVCQHRIYGVSAVGFISGVRYKTSDAIPPEKVGYFFKKVPYDILRVVVTHLNNFREINNLLNAVLRSYRSNLLLGSSTSFALQLQDDIFPEDIRSIKTYYPEVFIIKTFHVPSGDVSQDDLARLIQYISTYVGEVDAILLDSRTDDKIGGTGKTHNWDISRAIVDYFRPFPVLLAGGLNPSNVEQAIKAVRPFGVDANSGLKGEDGFKDEEKVKDFFLKAYNALCKLEQ